MSGDYESWMKDSGLPQVKVILETLYHVRRILPPLSIVETWFDTVLRPALREPKLAAEAVDHAKEVIVAAGAIQVRQIVLRQLKDAQGGCSDARVVAIVWYWRFCLAQQIWNQHPH